MTRLTENPKMKKRLEELGKRLREARIRNGCSQPQLAEMLGKSKQLVSAWERGTAEITSMTLALVAHRLHCDVNYLLLGGTRPEDKPLNQALASGHSVPKISTADVVHLAAGRIDLLSVKTRIPTYFACSHTSFAYELLDEAMAPQFLQGELVVVDPSRSAYPGSFVAAVVYSTAGMKFPRPTLVMRQIHFSTPIIGEPPYVLTPRAAGWPAIAIHDSKEAKIVGVLACSVRNRFAA